MLSPNATESGYDMNNIRVKGGRPREDPGLSSNMMNENPEGMTVTTVGFV
jgi:hypothetical protein